MAKDLVVMLHRLLPPKRFDPRKGQIHMRNYNIQTDHIRRGTAIERVYSAYMLGQISRAQYSNSVDYLLAL
ncbi:hypothetical protein [Paenibacillus taichungensis]|uniref:hypothetical protein n=1 Tax=Paenibacillus taichungensis TaxID=484184 RepID=UPI0035DEB6BA